MSLRLSGNAAVALGLLGLLGACALRPAERGEDAIREDLQRRLAMPVNLGSEEARGALERALGDGLLDADEAVGLAIAGNAGLRAVLQDLGIAEAELWQASLPRNPVLDAELQFEEEGGGDVLELSVAQNILDLILLPRRKQVAEARWRMTQAEVTAAVLDLAFETRVTYRRLQAQTELVALHGAATEAAYLAFDAARRLRAAGNIIELEVLQEEALHEETKVHLAMAQADERGLRENLNLLLGLWGPMGETWRLEPRLPDAERVSVAAGDVERRAITASLDLTSRYEEILALGHQMGIDKLQVMLPNFSAGVAVDRESSETWAVGPVLSTSIPIFDFGGAASAAAKARVRRAYEVYTDTAVRIRHTARDAFVRSSTLGESSRYLRQIVLPLRSRITEETGRQVNAMQVGVFHLIEAKRSEIDAARNYVETLRDHWIQRARLESILLGRLPRTRFGLAREAAVTVHPQTDRTTEALS